MMKKFGAFAGVALLLLVSVSLVSAQQAVSLGDTLQGGLTGEPVTFSIELNAGDVVTITAESTDFDSYVAVSDADGNLIGENDDGGATFGLYSNLTVIVPAGGS
ncbi:MAG: PPC domain-containing protein, partial [Anaerolineae bacterium]|nr:PPC domain-containing protein [Anaerolineae bacterium]